MLKAIIVDDEIMTRDILRNYIPWQELGIAGLKEAEDGVDALELTSEWEPDIVLTDIKMPRIDGIELATHIKQRYPNCKIIFLSGYSDKEYMKSAIKLKAVNYVEKPIDLEEITQVLKSAILECLQEKKEKDVSNRYLMEELTLDLTSSTIDFESIYSKIKELNLDFPENGNYLTIIVRPIFQDIENEGEKAAYIKQIVEEFNRSFENFTHRYISGLKGDDCILAHFSLNPHLEIYKITTALGNFIKETNNHFNGSCKCLVSIGQNVSGLCNIFISYQCAVITLQKQFFSSYNNIARYSEDNSPAYTFDDNNFLLITEYIKVGKKDEAISLIKKISNEIRMYKNTQPDYIKNIFFKIVLIISRAAEDRNISLLRDECKFILNSVSTAYTLSEIEENIVELISSVIAEMQGKSENADVIAKITHYIHDYFHDENLSINTLADKLYLTPTYICTLFKKATGKTINQYITEVRIEKAKDYLKGSDIKLYDIAQRVGFTDGKYFSKVFSKLVGIKPKEYREIHHHDEKNI